MGGWSKPNRIPSFSVPKQNSNGKQVTAKIPTCGITSCRFVRQVSVSSPAHTFRRSWQSRRPPLSEKGRDSSHPANARDCSPSPTLSAMTRKTHRHTVSSGTASMSRSSNSSPNTCLATRTPEKNTQYNKEKAPLAGCFCIINIPRKIRNATDYFQLYLVSLFNMYWMPSASSLALL